MKKQVILFIVLFWGLALPINAQTQMDADQPVSIKNALSGWATAIDGNWALISSPQKDNGAAQSIGEVSFMEYSDGRWALRQITQPAGLPVLSNFGYSVDMFRETAVVGSIGDHETGAYTGALFIYTLEGSSWQHQSTLRSQQISSGDRFGSAVDIQQNLLVAGAPMGEGKGDKTGKAIVYEYDGEWIETAELFADDGQNGGHFGHSVQIINNSMIAVGAHKASGAEGQTGAVYIFSRNGEAWEQTAKLSAPSGRSYDLFGYSLATYSLTDSEVLFVGSPGSENSEGQTGSVFAFSYKDGSWSSDTEIAHEEATINAHFGISLAANEQGDLLVGASRVHSEDHKQAGKVYAYRIEESSNPLTVNSTAALRVTEEQSFSQFGAHVSISDDVLLISSPYDDRNDLTNSGSVYFYDTTLLSNERDTELPTRLELSQNYPNPFNPSTTIQFTLPQSSNVSLEVFDMLGRKVATLIDTEQKPAGNYTISFNADHLATGVYMYRLKAGEQIKTQKMTLIK